MVPAKDIDFGIRILSPGSSEECLGLLKAVDVDPYAEDILLPKMKHFNILLQKIDCRVANIIKQAMLSLGGDAAVARETVSCSIPSTNVILMGTEKQIRLFANHIKVQPFGLKYLSAKLEDLLANYQRTDRVLCTNKREIALGKRTHIMGVVNVTPDSFSDGGKYLSAQAAIDRALELESEGADFVDIGGESSRPGSEFISEDEELERIIPVIKGLQGKLSIPISVDTLKAAVAEEAIAAGAEIINDISAMTFDQRMASVIAENQVAVVLMHMKGIPKTMQRGAIIYADLMADIICHLSEQIKNALSHGIQSEKIVVDPGVGFGKTVQNNLAIIRNLSELKIFGLPILTGVSRKSFIGSITNVGTPAERLEGTAAAITASIMNGSHIVRVHDVASARKIIAMTDAIVRG
jgi:dihydropteroate synthase